MGLAAFLSTELDVVLADAASPKNLWRGASGAALERVRVERVAAAIERGAESDDDDVVVGCIAIAIDSWSLTEVGGVEDADRRIFALHEHITFARADAWIDKLVACIVRNGTSAALAVEALSRFTELRETWPDPVLRSVCVAVLPLIAALDGPQREQVARVLATIADRYYEEAGDLELAVPRLIEMLDDCPGAAAHALSQIPDPRAIEPLIAMLGSNAPSSAKCSAVEALRNLRAKAAVPALLRLLEETSDNRLREWCLGGVAELDPVTAAPIVARILEPELDPRVLWVAGAGAQAGDAASIAMLERGMRSTDDRVRATALELLAPIRGSAMLGDLCSAVNDASDRVVEKAVAQLRALADPRAFDALVIALERGQANAATALAELADPRAIEPLIASLAVDEPNLADLPRKIAVVQALGDLGFDRDDVWAALVARLGGDRSRLDGHHAAVACQQLRPGCLLGAHHVVRYIGQLPYVRGVRIDGELPGLVQRLDAVARSGKPPLDGNAAHAILRAMRRLRDELAEMKHARTASLSELIETWERWLA